MSSAINSTSFECKPIANVFLQNLSAARANFTPVVAIPFAVLNGLTALPTFLINLLVMWTVLESRRLRSSNYNILVAILSVSDLLTGLVVQPLFISFCACYLSSCSYLCELRMAYVVTGMFCGRQTVFALALVSLERYLNIQHPLKYCSSANKKKKIIIIVAFGWIIIGASVLLQTIDGVFLVLRRSIWFLFLVPLSAIIVFCSLKVYMIVRRQRRAIAAQRGVINRISNQSKKNEFKRNSTLLVGLVLYLLLNIPLAIVKLLKTADGEIWSPQRENLLAHVWVTCLHLQSLFNSLVYSIRLSDIRKGVKKKLPQLKRPSISLYSTTVNPSFAFHTKALQRNHIHDLSEVNNKS